MISLPSDFNIKAWKLSRSDAGIPSDPPPPRLAVPQVISLVKAVLDDTIKVGNASYVKGVAGEEWTEVRTIRGDILAFFVRDESITNCFYCQTPSGREWRMDVDGGSPMVGQPIEIQRQCTSRFLKREHAETVDVEQIYRVVLKREGRVMPVTHLFDKGYTPCGMPFPTELGVSPIFYDDSAAKLAAIKYAKYRSLTKDKKEPSMLDEKVEQQSSLQPTKSKRGKK